MFGRKRKPVTVADMVVDDRHTVGVASRPRWKGDEGAKIAWTHTEGPTVWCEGSGRKGLVTVKDDVMFVRCRRCRYAVQTGWGKKMIEHEREARGRERDA